MFGGIFDYNRDEKTDAFEMTLGISVAFGSDEEGCGNDCFDATDGG